MILREILRAKGHLVHGISPDATLAEVVQKLVRNNCGSLVVCEDTEATQPRMLGIITERDILRACAAHADHYVSITVREVMTADVTVGTPADSVEDTMGLMTEMRIRHLPVVEDGQLMGLVSIGDVVKAQHDSLSLENHYLKNYIHG